MPILYYYLSLSGRLITAFLTGLAAGYLLIKWAEKLMLQKARLKTLLLLSNTENDRIKAAILMAAGSVCLLVRRSADWHLLFSWLFFCILFLSGYIDQMIWVIPNEGIVTALFLWGFRCVCMGESFPQIILKFLLSVIFAALLILIVAILERGKKRTMLGRGDIKLLFVTALCLGMERTLYVLALSCLCGLMLVALSGKKDKRRQIPFGPCIAFSGFLVLLV